MPSERFFNLPDEKKQRITDAAITEFSRVPFDQVSINKIIQSAEIPRGSFYQYFENKLDLLQFVLEDLRKIMSQTIRTTIQKTNGDFFAVVLAILDLMIATGIRGEKQAFFRNVFSNLRTEESAAIFPYLQIHALTEPPACCSEDQELIRAFTDYSERLQSKGIPQEDLLNVTETVIALMHYTVAQLFFYPENADSIRYHFEQKLAILKRGLQKGV